MRAGKKNRIKMAIVIVLLLVFTVGTILATRWVLSLQNPDKLEWFRATIESMGVGGWFVLLAIQYVQIVIAFIPGGPIQIVAGALYGPLGGLAVCFAGTFLATATVFYLVRRFGHSIISLFVDEKDILKYKFLNDSKRVEWLVLILFFIPGAPKDALTYLFALTSISMSRFLLLSTLARMPAVLTSVFAGNSIVEGNWTQAVILFVALTVLSLLGLLFHRKVLRHFAQVRKGGKGKSRL